ncbi:MAG: radical SAM protein [Thermogutta sp.]
MSKHSFAEKGNPIPAFKLDVPVHELLKRPSPRAVPSPQPSRPAAPLTLPEPVFPQHPELLVDPPGFAEQPHVPPARRHWSVQHIFKAMRGWVFPYFRSRLLPGDFHPIIAYLFTEYKCNLDCHYCWAYDNSVKGMSEEVARRSIDWLCDNGAGVLALMGGEPLLRPQFVHKVIYYASKKGMWVYLPTNGRLLRPAVIDRLADAGVATVNLAVDAVDLKPGLPKALAPVRSNFDYLVKKQYRYGYTVFFNINICRNNLDDVRQLTEIAHDNGIATDYHLNESPLIEQDDHFKHLKENVTYITPEDYDRVDELLDWLIEKNRSGYKMVDSVARLMEMKKFMRGQHESWNCRAGLNSLIIRVDGTLAPCFPMYSANYDWGTVGDHKFDVRQLDEMKTSCTRHCFSTLNHNLAMCYDTRRVVKYLARQAARGFQGLTGSIE